MFYDHINWPFHILFMSFFTGSAILFWWLDRRRRSDFDYAAKSLHLEHKEPTEATVETIVNQFQFFQKKPGVVHEYVYGAYRQLSVQVFNYTHRKTRDPEMSQIFSCVLIKLPNALPDLRIAPNDSDKPWKGDDLVFTQADQFHKRYQLRSRSPLEVREKMNDAVIAFFSKWDDLEVEAFEQELLFTARRALQPENLQNHLERAWYLTTLLLNEGKASRVQS